MWCIQRYITDAIYKNENAAEVTREFYNRYAINEDALFSLLDRVCIGDSLCQPHDIIFDETIKRIIL